MRVTARRLASVLALLAALAPSLAVGQESTANDAAVEPAGFSSLQKSLIIPGWGQLAEKRYFEGIAFLSAEILCLAGFLSYNHSANAYYDRYQSADNREDAIRFRALAEKYDTRRNRVLLAAAAVWVVNLIDIYAIVKKNEKNRERCAWRWAAAQTRSWRLLFLIAASWAAGPACQDRVFDNPFDPNASSVIFEIVATISTPATAPRGLTWDGSTLWNVDASTNSLLSLNSLNGSLLRSLPSPLPDASGVAYDGRDLWVCSRSGATVAKINLLNGDTLKSFNLQRGIFTALDFKEGALWLAEAQSNKIMRVDPETGEMTEVFVNPGTRADGLVFDGQSFWLSDASTLTIYQVASGGSLERTFLSPGPSPQGLTHDGLDLWNVDGNQKIYRLRLSH